MVLRAPRPWLLVASVLTSGCLSRRIDAFIDELEFTTTAATTTQDPSSTTDPPGTTTDRETGETTGPATTTTSSSTSLADTSSADGSTDSSTGSSTDSAPPSICGDGQLADDEECDDGNTTPDDGCSATCAADLRVFVTSQLYKAGDLMSPYKADALCLHRAMDAGLPAPERFKAWLSDSSEHARDRFNHTRGRLVLINGLVVAQDWETLLGGALDNPIEVTEQGQTYHGKVWTGTKVDGLAAANTTHCEDWSSISLTKSAYYGYSDEISHEWTLADQPDNPAACPVAFAIYCIESF